MARTLYLSYDGLTDPLGQSQILPYMQGLSRLGHDITIISFEKAQNQSLKPKIQSMVQEANINWIPLTYTKQPPVFSTVWDLLRLTSKVFAEHSKKPFDIVHCRSYVTSIVGLSLKRKRGVKFIFDMRDLWVDERVDGGIWNLSNLIFRMVYKYFKYKESQFRKECDHLITLTEAAKNLIGLSGKTSVIPTCVEIDFFSNPTKLPSSKVLALGIEENDFVLGYLGSLGSWYKTKQVWQVFKEIDKIIPNSKLLIVTKSDTDTAKAELSAARIDMKKVIFTSGSRDDMPGLIQLFDWCIFFYDPKPSKLGAAPTRLAEVVCQQIPVISNAKIGDFDTLFEEYNLGYLVKDLGNSDQLKEAACFVNENGNYKSDKRLVEDKFSLTKAVNRLNEIYHS